MRRTGGAGQSAAAMVAPRVRIDATEVVVDTGAHAGERNEPLNVRWRRALSPTASRDAAGRYFVSFLCEEEIEFNRD